MLCQLENKEGIRIREVERDSLFKVVEIPDRDSQTGDIIGVRQFRFVRWLDYEYQEALYKEF
jgi:hypothetical protein